MKDGVPVEVRGLHRQTIVFGSFHHRFGIWKAIAFDLFVPSVGNGFQSPGDILVDFIAKRVKLNAYFVSVLVVLSKAMTQPGVLIVATAAAVEAKNSRRRISVSFCLLASLHGCKQAT